MHAAGASPSVLWVHEGEGGAQAVEGEEHESEPEMLEVHHEGHHAHLGVFVGDTVVDGDHGLTLGLDYVKMLADSYCLAFMLDYAGEHDIVAGAAMFGFAPLETRPGHLTSISLIAGPGITSEDNETLFLVRAGVYWAVTQRFAPVAYVDFLEGGEQNFVFGVTAIVFTF